MISLIIVAVLVALALGILLWPKRPRLAIVIGTYLVILAGVLVAAVLLFDRVAYQPNISQTSAPVTREAAVKYLGPNLLPPGAKNIQYYLMDVPYSPAFDTVIRFEAPLDECHAQAAAILGKTPLQPDPNPGRENHGDIPQWFVPGQIVHCVSGGKGFKGEPRIWIDEDRGVLYYLLSD